MTYEYSCDRCAAAAEHRFAMGDQPETVNCRRFCGGTARRVYTSPAVQVDDDNNFFWRSSQRRQTEQLRDAEPWRRDEMQGFGTTRAGVLS